MSLKLSTTYMALAFSIFLMSMSILPVQAQTTPTPSSTTAGGAPVSISYLFGTSADTASLSWDTVPPGTTYIVVERTSSATGQGGTVYLKPDGKTRIFLKDYSDAIPAPIRADDKYTVTFKDTSLKTLGSGRSVSTEVVQQQTEFGPIANIGEYAQRIMKYALPIGIALGIIMTIYAGITLMLSQGSPDKIKSAQEAIQGAILGLIILILVRVLVGFLYIPTIDSTSPAALQDAQSQQTPQP